jgi:hypothetical protein
MAGEFSRRRTSFVFWPFWPPRRLAKTLAETLVGVLAAFQMEAYGAKELPLKSALNPLETSSTTPQPPPLASLLKPEWMKRLIENKEILESASLKDVPDSPNRVYSFFASMRVGASLEITRKILTNYRLYSEMVPYVDRTIYNSKQQILWIEGGIWGFRLGSQIRFQELNDRWIRYRIISGHFAGLVGELIFESLGEKGTLVYFRGEQSGTDWPPRFVIERGAEIVFGFTAGRMRSYIEAQKKSLRGAGNGPEIGNGNRSHQGQEYIETGEKSGKEKSWNFIPQPKSHF